MDGRRTGALVKALAEGVRDDLGDVVASLEAIRVMVEELGDSARAINGLGVACAGWSSHIASLVAEVQKEQREVPAKLLGTPLHAITSSVNTDHVEAVTAARRKAS